MKIPIVKLKAILRYFSTYTDQRFLGKVKLMKLLYFLDFTHVKRFGSPITYDRYVNLEHGPIPSTILNLVTKAIDDVDDSVLGDTIQCEKTSNGMYRISTTHRFDKDDEDYFSESELEVLKNVVNRFKDSSKAEIENAAHSEAPWNQTKLLDNIPYSLAAEDDDCRVSKEEIEFFTSL